MIHANVLAATERKEAALAEYEAASAELAWWLQGAELAGLVVEDGDTPDVADYVELFPPGAYFETSSVMPTLRQAVVAHLREHPVMPSSIAALTQALVLRGWLPEREDAQKRVSDIAGLMASDGQLQRVERGVYRLRPRLAAAFDQPPSPTTAVPPRWDSPSRLPRTVTRNDAWRGDGALRSNKPGGIVPGRETDSLSPGARAAALADSTRAALTGCRSARPLASRPGAGR